MTSSGWAFNTLLYSPRCNCGHILVETYKELHDRRVMIAPHKLMQNL